ncbi:zinc finger, CCHC-type containing protein, partial [Tanacetum coccineum]
IMKYLVNISKRRALTKITKKPFQNVKREIEVLELIHNDLCDLHATPSLGNKRTDRGGEYMDTLYFQYVGIIYETTAPYTSQQNGISERKNKVLKEMVNSMLSYSRLSLGYNDVPPPYTENFMPPKHDLSGLEEFVNEPIVNEPTVKKSVVEISEAKDNATNL